MLNAYFSAAQQINLIKLRNITKAYIIFEFLIDEKINHSNFSFTGINHWIELRVNLVI